MQVKADPANRTTVVSVFQVSMNESVDAHTKHLLKHTADSSYQARTADIQIL
jgi:hypothetical protein